MNENSVPELVVDERLEVGVLLVGSSAGMAAAYHTGQTGNWEPLLAISLALSLFVLFVTSQ